MDDEKLRERARQGIKQHGANEAAKRLEIAPETVLRFAVGERVLRGTALLIGKNIRRLDGDR